MNMQYPGGDVNTHAPIALIFADSNAGRTAASDAAIASGGRIAATLEISQGKSRLHRQAVANAIIIEVTRDHGSELDHLIAGAVEFAAREDAALIISAPIDMIDLVAPQLANDRVTLLCQPDVADRIGALMMAWRAKPIALHDIGGEIESVRLKRLADEVSRIARALAGLAAVRDVTQASMVPDPVHFDGPQSRSLALAFAPQPSSFPHATMPSANEIRAMLRLRRLRANFFAPDLFADPAWDMLLDLMAARLDNEQVAVSSLCIAASVPPTTALRWIKTMSDYGLFERCADPLDGRRIFIRLSDEAAQAMATYFMAAKRLGGLSV